MVEKTSVLKLASSVDVVDSGTDFVSDSVVLGSSVLVESSGHPSLSGPLASVSPSAQHPNSEDLQAGGGGGQPSWSLPSAAVLLSDEQHPKRVSAHGIIGQPSLNGPSAGDNPSGQQPNLDS